MNRFFIWLFFWSMKRAWKSYELNIDLEKYDEDPDKLKGIRIIIGDYEKEE